MAMKFYSSTLTHRCPKCGTVLKKEKHDDALAFIYFFLFIPVGLIALIVYLIKRKTTKVEYNEYGEQIICCPSCYSFVAIGSNGGFAGYSRIIKQEKDLLDMMMPIIKYLKNDFEISCSKYNNDQKYSEMLGLCFKNEFGDKCNVFVLNIHNKIQMKIESEAYEELNMNKLVIKVTEKLL